MHTQTITLTHTKATTHHYNEEVEPAPGVGEVLGKTKRHPFDQHLDKEYDGENPVHVVEYVLEGGSPLQVDVLQGQGQRRQQDHGDDGRLEVLVLNQLVSLQPQMAPALPEGGFRVALYSGKIST